MLRFAVVGLGMGRNRARQVRETTGAELTVVVDLDAGLAQEVAAEMECEWASSLDAALERDDVDAVIVMTPSGLHAKLGVQAAQAGKHVVTTKPMDVSTAACDELIAAAAEHGVKLGVDYQSRYVDNNYRIAEALDRGWLGSPILGEIRFKWFRSQDYFEHGTGWRGTWAMDGGGALANQGSHLIDLLLWFMGEPVRVYGETAIAGHEIETEDLGLAIINFQSGAKGTVVGTTTFPTNVYFSAEVHGSQGGILLDEALSGTMRVFGDGLEEKLGTLENTVNNVVEDLLQAVTNDTQMRVDGIQGRRTVALLENIYASARQGRPLQVS